MRSIGRITILSGVLAAALTAVAWAQPQGGGMQQHGQMGHGTGQGAGQGMGPMHGPMGVLANLNLTDDQRQQIHKLMADTQTDRQADIEQMRKLHDQLRDQLFGDNGPSGNAGATGQEINSVMGRMIQAHVQLAEKISAILTADQRRQLREMPMSDMMGMLMMMHGGMGGSPSKK